MENEATISETGTATSYDDLIGMLETSYNEETDMPDEASDVESEQADTEHVEDETTSDVEDDSDVDAPDTEADTEEQFFEINGEQVPFSELQSGYLRQADYTRKTQELAEQRKQYQLQQIDINSLKRDVVAELDHKTHEIAALLSLVEEPDWDYLVENEPAEFQRQLWLKNKREQQIGAKLNELYAHRAALVQQAEEHERTVRERQIRDSYQQLIAHSPEWKDESYARNRTEAITELFKEKGFDREEIGGITDWRIILFADEHLKMRQTQNAVKPTLEKLEKKPPISQKTPSVRKSDNETKAKSKFNKTRSYDDFISYLEQSL
ncbi:hypothetical protein CN165_12725 [Sinorhizobium medicae]|uniref:hypothetical protein n=1 Tax=Sinorhizobium medicae TaxID=110321 RepID=UPI000FDBB5D7|nr:hypothetical protein [Sinorhizobium medicae]RVK19426.1 hypothetical protein CN165_12725 [Sinorhizobium medicae]